MKLPYGVEMIPLRTLYTEIRHPDGSLKDRWAHAIVFRVESRLHRHMTRCAAHRERRRKRR